MNIGLALSGGGFRATVFHLGVMGRLVDEDLLKDVTALSTVSGGSLCIGLVFAANGYRWPTGDEYRKAVVPHIRRLLTTYNLQGTYLQRILRSPLSLFSERADDVSRLMQEMWGISARVTDQPREPYWAINATCYETGVNWRFSAEQMGDYLFGYCDRPAVPLADAMAASAAFPGFIGPLAFDVRPHTWKPYKSDTPVKPMFDKVRLWDGGVYENLGVEALFKPGRGYQRGVDFLITCDAGARPGAEKYSLFKSGYRLISVATNQVRSLRARSVVAHLQDDGAGSYLQIDNSARYLFERAHRSEEEMHVVAPPAYLSDEEVAKAAQMESTLRQLTDEEFKRLFRQGYEVADVTMHVFKSGGSRPLLGYDAARWG